MNDIPPVGTQLGALTIEDVLVEFDGPRLFTCLNELDQRYMAVHVDEDEQSETYLYSPLSTGRLRDVLAGRVSLREAFQQPAGAHVWKVTRSLVDCSSTAEAMPASDILPEWLPAGTARVPSPHKSGAAESSRGPDDGSFGSPDALLFEVKWPKKENGPELLEHSRVQVRLSIGGHVLWPSAASAEYDTVSLAASEVLQFLGRAWGYLSWEEGLPLNLPIADLKIVQETLSRERNRASLPTRRQYESTYEEFLTRHDLSQMSTELALRPVVLVKQGLFGWILTEDDASRFEVSELLGALEELGNHLAGRVDSLTGDLVVQAVDNWRHRRDYTPTEVAEISTGWGAEDVDQLQEASPEFAQEVLDSVSNPAESELLAAARLSAGLAPSQASEIISCIASVSRIKTPELDQLSERLRDSLVNSVFAYDEGYEAARWLRGQLNLAAGETVDPEGLLERFNVLVKIVELPSAKEVDAIAVWGPRRGPCVVINSNGQHAQGGAGRRITTAHELGHLLLDRAGALPVADVLRGQESSAVETRARAFAAELLLPQQVAGEAYLAAPDNPMDVVRSLARQYGVSNEVVAWNIRNSGVDMSSASRAQLKKLVQHPWRY